MTHYSETDLLEMHYLDPYPDTAMAEHVASCRECAGRLSRIEEKLRDAAATAPEKSDAFWARQRLSITRRIEQQRRQSISIGRTLRVAAATVLAFFLGGVVVYRAVEPGVNPPRTTAPATAATASAAAPKNDDLQLTRDPWQSDELNDFHSVVSWESWIDTSKGGQL